MLANPAMLVPVVALYTANAAVRTGFRAAEYKAQKDTAAALDKIATAMYTADNGDTGLTTLVSQLKNQLSDLNDKLVAYDPIDEGDLTLSEWLERIRQEIRDLETGIEELHLHINNLVDSQDHEMAWSRHTP